MPTARTAGLVFYTAVLTSRLLKAIYLDDRSIPLKKIEDDPGMCQRIEQKIIHFHFRLQTIILIKQLKLLLFDQVSTY